MLALLRLEDTAAAVVSASPAGSRHGLPGFLKLCSGFLKRLLGPDIGSLENARLVQLEAEIAALPTPTKDTVEYFRRLAGGAIADWARLIADDPKQLNGEALRKLAKRIADHESKGTETGLLLPQEAALVRRLEGDVSPPLQTRGAVPRAGGNASSGYVGSAAGKYKRHLPVAIWSPTHPAHALALEADTFADSSRLELAPRRDCSRHKTQTFCTQKLAR